MRKLMMMMATMLAFCSAATAAERFVTFVPEGDTQRLCTGDISYSENDFEAVKIAIGSLKADMQQSLTESYTAGDGLTLLIGTLGKNADIDRLVKQGQLSDLKGKREKFIITTIGKQLVIAGSDRRGTVYGIYELSEQLGVSPWYWWMDVPVEPHACAYIRKGSYTDGEPAVEFRGLFLNDEAPCLTSWVKNTWGTDYGDHVGLGFLRRRP